MIFPAIVAGTVAWCVGLAIGKFIDFVYDTWFSNGDKTIDFTNQEKLARELWEKDIVKMVKAGFSVLGHAAIEVF